MIQQRLFKRVLEPFLRVFLRLHSRGAACGSHVDGGPACRATGCGTRRAACTAAPRIKGEARVLWDCPAWEDTRSWALQAAAELSQGPPEQWPACVPRTGLMPLSLTDGAGQGSLDDFRYRLYGMSLGVLAARMADDCVGQPGPGDSPLPAGPAAKWGRGVSVVGPRWPPAALATGAPTPACGQGCHRGGSSSWPLPRTWSGGQEPSLGRRSQGRSHGQSSPWTSGCLSSELCKRRPTTSCGALGERVHVLRQAVRLLQQHLAVGRLLWGMGQWGFQLGGVWEKGSIDRTINQLLGTVAPKAPKFFFEY